MHFMLETILAGYALGVDPFDQPAVEEGKILAKRISGAGMRRAVIPGPRSEPGIHNADDAERCATWIASS